MEIKKIILSLVFFSLIFTYPLNYKIKYFGIYVADCKISNIDTTYKQSDTKKITFSVKTKPFFKYLFPVDNNYVIILDKNNKIVFFSKKTFQPKVENFIETEIREGIVFYQNSDLKIPKDSYNIFSLLYSIMDNKIPKKEFILEKEGMIYNASINSIDSNIYDLTINGLEGSDNKTLIQNTDIFTWGIFLKNTKRRFIIDVKSGLINKCFFKRGIVTIKAELDN